MKKGKISLIGTGIAAGDVSRNALERIYSADVLVGTRRLLERFSDTKADKIEIKRNVNILISILKNKHAGKNTVVLTSGDPNFFGIANLFYAAFPNRCLEVMPNITAFQEACARIHQPWDDAVFISVHGRKLEHLDRLLRQSGTFVVYCDGVNTPLKVARYLAVRMPSMKSAKAWIFEDMGLKTERISSGSLGRVRRKEWSSLAMMIIQHKSACRSLPIGIPDHAIAHQRGMITKKDVRLMVLSRLVAAKPRVLWDIGAGSGSVSIEAANLYPEMDIFAIEKNNKRYQDIVANIGTFRLNTIHPVAGNAPDVLHDLPSPDAVLIGGSGGDLPGIMAVVKRRIKSGGALVVNCVTPETLATALLCFKKWKWRYEVVAVQLAYLHEGAHPEIFKPQHQIFIAHARSPRPALQQRRTSPPRRACHIRR